MSVSEEKVSCVKIHWSWTGKITTRVPASRMKISVQLGKPWSQVKQLEHRLSAKYKKNLVPGTLVKAKHFAETFKVEFSFAL